jgi:c-di-GMP-binding flagellar brake protein YcgR
MLDDGTSVQALDLCCPTKMQRAQRRAYLRVDIPDNRIVRVSFWHGGSGAEPDAGQPDKPIWTGRVRNLSAGGVQVAVEPAVAEQLESGDFLGVHISFGAGDGAVQADAQFRHTEIADGQALLGLQFVGLEQTQRGQQTLLSISRRVAEYRKQAERRAWRAQAS